MFRGKYYGGLLSERSACAMGERGPPLECVILIELLLMIISCANKAVLCKLLVMYSTQNAHFINAVLRERIVFLFYVHSIQLFWTIHFLWVKQIWEKMFSGKKCWGFTPRTKFL